MASRKRIVICYILLQASFWGMLSSICAYQAAVVLDRGFTAGQAGIFCALCYFCLLYTSYRARQRLYHRLVHHAAEEKPRHG